MQFASLALRDPKGPQQLIKIRCERGAEIVRSLGFPESTAQAILHLDEHYNGKGHPCGLKEESISLLRRILCLCQTVEVFGRERGRSAALEVAQSRSKSWFDPNVVAAFECLAQDQSFCDSFLRDEPYEMLRHFEPVQHSRTIAESEFDQIAVAFSEVVDAKSSWTYRHCTRVAEISNGIAPSLDLSPFRLRRLRRAALWHDNGKLGVS